MRQLFVLHHKDKDVNHLIVNLLIQTGTPTGLVVSILLGKEQVVAILPPLDMTR